MIRRRIAPAAASSPVPSRAKVLGSGVFPPLWRLVSVHCRCSISLTVQEVEGKIASRSGIGEGSQDKGGRAWLRENIDTVDVHLCSVIVSYVEHFTGCEKRRSPPPATGCYPGLAAPVVPV